MTINSIQTEKYVAAADSTITANGQKPGKNTETGKYKEGDNGTNADGFVPQASDNKPGIKSKVETGESYAARTAEVAKLSQAEKDKMLKAESKGMTYNEAQDLLREIELSKGSKFDPNVMLKEDRALWVQAKAAIAGLEEKYPNIDIVVYQANQAAKK